MHNSRSGGRIKNNRIRLINYISYCEKTNSIRIKMNEKHISFDCDGLELEGILHIPKGEPPFPAVVVCHPHSLYGGSMRNNVVLAICEALEEASIAALRFNFRGVGMSDGEFAEGVGEQDDVVAALAFLGSLSEVDSDKIGLAGYSFGTKAALPVALRNDKVRAVALVSPFLSDTYWEQLKSYVNPKIFISGGNDGYIRANDVQQKVSELPEPKQYEIIANTDHFWLGFEPKVAESVTTFFTSILKTRTS